MTEPLAAVLRRTYSTDPIIMEAADEIDRLRLLLAEADHVIAAIELRGEPWTAELAEARTAAINRHKRGH